MDTTITDLTSSSQPVESPPRAATPAVRRAIPREVTKEFVRRPAKGWIASTLVPVVRFDHHCPVWEE